MVILTDKIRDYLISLKLEGVLSRITYDALVDNFLTERDLKEILEYIINNINNTKTKNTKK
jgi:hypothetical protein